MDSVVENKIGLDFMDAVGGDIIAIRVNGSMSFNDALSLFYDVMRKHGIKRYNVEKQEDGIETMVGNSFRWTMCETLFITHFTSDLRFTTLLFDLDENFPKDLEK